MNLRSILAKMDYVKILLQQTDPQLYFFLKHGCKTKLVMLIFALISMFFPM